MFSWKHHGIPVSNQLPELFFTFSLAYSKKDAHLLTQKLHWVFISYDVESRFFCSIDKIHRLASLFFYFPTFVNIHALLVRLSLHCLLRKLVSCWFPLLGASSPFVSTSSPNASVFFKMPSGLIPLISLQPTLTSPSLELLQLTEHHSSRPDTVFCFV